MYSIIIDLREHLLTIPTDIIMGPSFLLHSCLDDRMIPFEDIRWYDPPILLGKGNFAVAYVGYLLPSSSIAATTKVKTSPARS